MKKAKYPGTPQQRELLELLEQLLEKLTLINVSADVFENKITSFTVESERFVVKPNLRKKMHADALELGRKGGQARAKNRSAAELSAIGKKAAAARWAKKGGK